MKWGQTYLNKVSSDEGIKSKKIVSTQNLFNTLDYPLKVKVTTELIRLNLKTFKTVLTSKSFDGFFYFKKTSFTLIHPNRIKTHLT